MALNFIPKLSAQSKETQLSLYLQDITAGPNATDIPLVGISGKLWSYTQFATIYTVDDPITEGLDPNSASVGRAQGLTMTSGLEGRNALVLISIVFTNKEYNGSTLEIKELVSNLRRLENYRRFHVPGNFDLLGDMLHLKQ